MNLGCIRSYLSASEVLEAVVFYVVDDSTAAHAQFVRDFLGRKAFIVETDKLFGLASENIFGRVFLFAQGSAELLAVGLGPVKCLSAAFSLDFLDDSGRCFQISDEIYRGLVGKIMSAVIQGNDRDAFFRKNLQYTDKHIDTTAKAAEGCCDHRIAGEDRLQEFGELALQDASCCEVFLKDFIVLDTTLPTPTLKGLALLSE